MNELRLSDLFGQPQPGGPQYSLSVPMGYGYDPSWGRAPPIGRSLMQSILGGPGQPPLTLKPEQLNQPGLMFRVQIPF